MEEVYLRWVFRRSKHLVIDLFERASRCYELRALALDAQQQSFEQRDALGSSDEFSEVVWSQTHYKAFVGAKPARSRKEDRRNAGILAPSEPLWAALAAIDWADQKHFWRLLPAGSQQQEQGELDNTPEAVEVWAGGLHQRFGGRPIGICLEQSRGALVYMLTKYPRLVLFPVHPTTAASCGW